MTIGIYSLKFTGTNKVYIGQSDDIERRFKDHLRLFKRESHSKKLQTAYDEFGTPDIEILYECSLGELDKIENETIEKFDAVNNGFNSLEKAGSIPDNRGEKHGRSVYSNEQIINVFYLLISTKNISFEEISDITNVNYNVIGNISAGNRHRWLETDFPEEYKILLSKIGCRNKGRVYPNILCPTGVLYENIKNASAFARDHGLSKNSFHSLLKGKIKSHKGWKLAL